jgi:hypothetical protein
MNGQSLVRFISGDSAERLPKPCEGGRVRPGRSVMGALKPSVSDAGTGTLPDRLRQEPGPCCAKIPVVFSGPGGYRASRSRLRCRAARGHP